MTNREKTAAYRKVYDKKNAVRIAAVRKLYNQRKAAEIKIKNAEYYRKNIERAKIRSRIYNATHKVSIERKLEINLRSRIRKTHISRDKHGYAIDSLGCSFVELRRYVESKFEEGMSWDNYSPNGWHLDHIIPFNLFDVTDDEQIKKVCHFSNLQPLWARENRMKRNRLISYLKPL